MNQQPGPEQGAAAPRYSPDGRWWWNGREWQPVSTQARLAASSTRRIRPGRWLYILAALAVAVGVVVFVAGLLIAPNAFSTIANATRITAPGTSQIELAEAGTYTISYEHQTVGNFGGSVAINGTPPNIPPEVSSMQLALLSTASDTSVPIRAPSATVTYSAGNTEGVAIGVFSVDRPGTYTLTSRYADGQSQPQIVLAIARGGPGAVIGQGFLLILAVFAGLGLAFVGLAVGAVTLFFRMRAKDRAGAAESLRPR